MDLNFKDIQLQYEGFLNTPLLWKSSSSFGLKQFNLPINKLSQFTIPISKNLRLGKRVEKFISYELQQHNSISIISENLQIQNNKITLGEIDFIIKKNNTPIHLEVMYKFYLYDNTLGNTELQHWIGPNKKDSLVAKLTKVKEKQFALLHNKTTIQVLNNLNISLENIKQLVCFKAQLFVPFVDRNNVFEIINNKCIKGFYISYKELNIFENCKFYIPTKVNWLQEIQTHINWMSFDKFYSKVEAQVQIETSPLCWLKQPNGEVDKFFVIWW